MSCYYSQLKSGLKLPLRAGEYTLIQEIAIGGCSVVWLAINPQQQETILKFAKDYKINPDGKIVTLEPLMYEGNSTALYNEFSALKKLKSQYFPNVYSFENVIINNKRVPVLVMEYVKDYQLLSEYIKKRRVNSFQVNVRLCKEFINALNVLEKNEILHKDLKPNNIFILIEAEKVNLKLIDLGSSALYWSDPILANATFSDFSAPELYKGKTSLTSDIYSAGGIMYYLFTGTLPPTAKQREEKYKTITPPIFLNSEIDKSLSDMIIRCLCLDPNQRATLKEIKRCIETLETTKPEHNTNTNLPPRTPTNPKKEDIKKGVRLLIWSSVFGIFSGAMINILPVLINNIMPYFNDFKGVSQNLIIPTPNQPTPVISITPPKTPSPTPSQMIITGSISYPVNFRKKPNITSTLITKLKTGVTVTILEILDTGWVKINTKGTNGFIFGKYIEPPPEGFTLKKLKRDSDIIFYSPTLIKKTYKKGTYILVKTPINSDLATIVFPNGKAFIMPCNLED